MITDWYRVYRRYLLCRTSVQTKSRCVSKITPFHDVHQVTQLSNFRHIVSCLNICTISDRSSKMAWFCKQANRICPFLLWFRWLGGPLDGDTPGRSFMPRHLGRTNNCLPQVKADGEKKTKICHLFAFPYMVTYCRATAIDKCPWLCPCLCRNQFSSANGSPHQVFGGIACLTLYRSN